MKKVLIFILFISYNVFAGTDFDSAKNESYKKALPKSIVFYVLADVATVKEVESNAVDECKNSTPRAKETICVPFSSLSFIGKQYSEEEVRKIAEKNKNDAFIYLKPTVAGSNTGTQVYNAVGQNAAVSNTVDKPWIRYEASLIDAKSGEIIWSGSGETRGNAFSNKTDVFRTAGKKTIRKLKDDGLIK